MAQSEVFSVDPVKVALNSGLPCGCMTPGIPATSGTAGTDEGDGEAVTDAEARGAALSVEGECPGRPMSQTTMPTTMITPNAGFQSLVTPKPPSSTPCGINRSLWQAMRQMLRHVSRALKRPEAPPLLDFITQM